MKFLLIFPPPYWQKLYPLNIAYLSGILKKYKIDFEFYDLNILIYHQIKNSNLKFIWTDVKFQNSKYSSSLLLKNYSDFFDDFIKNIISKNYDYICFTTYTSNFNTAYYLSKIIKSSNTHSKIIFGGPEILYRYLGNKNFYKNFPVVDFFCVGEGEKLIEKIINCNKYFTAQNRSMQNASAHTDMKLIKFFEYENIDEIPFPFYYKENLNLYDRKRALSILTSRGCMNQCSFCAEKFLYKKTRIRSAENVFDEIKYLIKNYNVLWITFFDSMINTSQNELFKLCKMIIDNNIKIHWDAQFYLKNYSIELLDIMKRAGCFNLFVGVESCSEKILALMNKKFNTDDIHKFFSDCKKIGLHFEISLIFNFFGETMKEFNETLSFLKKYKNLIPKIAQVNNFKKMPGIKFQKEKYNTADDENQSDNISDKINKIELFKKFLAENKFLYTKEFINNL